MAADTSLHQPFKCELFSRENAFKPVELSPCREVVVVPLCSEFIIGRLEEAFPDYTWRYCSVESIVQYYYNQALKDEDYVHESVDDVQRPTFYAVLPHYHSPIDFTVQPKSLAKVGRHLRDEMNAFYGEGNGVRMTTAHIVPGVACATKDCDNWMRCRVKNKSGDVYVSLEIIDIGVPRIVPIEHLYRLERRFGKLPPLALPCVSRNDLENHKILEFQELIKACKELVRVELLIIGRVNSVNLYHPTLVGDNLGLRFLPRPINAEHEAAKQRKFEAHLRRQNNECDSDFEQDEEFCDEEFVPDEEEEEAAVALFVQALQRAHKIPRFVNELIPGHVENSRVIFVHENWHLTMRDRLEDSMRRKMLASELEPLPDAWIDKGFAAIFYDGATCYRCSIESVEDGVIEICLTDHGKWVRLPSAANLFSMPEEFGTEAPLLYILGLPERSMFPHFSATKLLREVLENQTISYKEQRGSRRKSRHAILTLPNGDDVETTVLSRYSVAKRAPSFSLSDLRVDPQCRDVLPYEASAKRLALLDQMDSAFTYRHDAARSLLRGNYCCDVLP